MKNMGKPGYKAKAPSHLCSAEMLQKCGYKPIRYMYVHK